MSFESFNLNTLDLIVIILVLLMSIKGLMNGFLRELFGFLGLIGGIIVASRLAEPIAKYIDSSLFHLGSFATLKLIGFIAVLATIWATVSFLGTLFVGISKGHEHSTISRIFGFLTAGIKYFLIFALIVSALFRSPLMIDNMAKHISQSKLYPTLDEVGAELINMTPLGVKIEIKDKKG